MRFTVATLCLLFSNAFALPLAALAPKPLPTRSTAFHSSKAIQTQTSSSDNTVELVAEIGSGALVATFLLAGGAYAYSKRTKYLADTAEGKKIAKGIETKYRNLQVVFDKMTKRGTEFSYIGPIDPPKINEIVNGVGQEAKKAAAEAKAAAVKAQKEVAVDAQKTLYAMSREKFVALLEKQKAADLKAFGKIPADATMDGKPMVEALTAWLDMYNLGGVLQFAVDANVKRVSLNAKAADYATSLVSIDLQEASLIQQFLARTEAQYAAKGKEIGWWRDIQAGIKTHAQTMVDQAVAIKQELEKPPGVDASIPAGVENESAEFEAQADKDASEWFSRVSGSNNQKPPKSNSAQAIVDNAAAAEPVPPQLPATDTANLLDDPVESEFNQAVQNVAPQTEEEVAAMLRAFGAPEEIALSVATAKGEQEVLKLTQKVLG